MRLLLFAFIITILTIIMGGCYKEYIPPEPSCNWVHMLIDNYKPDTSYISTDTFWYSGIRGKADIMCDSSLLRVKEYKPFLQGCQRDGYSCIRYVIGNHKTQPINFKK